LAQFKLHRNIPGIRHIYHRLDEARRERDGLSAKLGRVAAELDETRRERDRAIRERDEAAGALEAATIELDHLRGSIPSPAVKELYHFRGYDIPVELMRLTGGGPDTFDAICDGHIGNLARYVGLEPHFTVLELGCGIGRDAIPLSQILDPTRGGRYIGIDISRPSIEWCVSNIQLRNPHFIFFHMDVADQLHNASGKVPATETYLPVPDRFVDRVVLQSVFTHMLRPEIEHYLSEFKRILRPDGLIYATVFLYNDSILEKARSTNLTIWNLLFEHEVGPGCRINDLAYPTGAVAYTRELMDELITKNGLRHVREPLKGAWSGFYQDPEDGQDVLILRQ
jgi:SAM-dependent methyltransferase